MNRLKLTITLCLLMQMPLSIAQTCISTIIADAPTSRYTLNANGTLVDKKTALTWMRCALGQTWANGFCGGTGTTYSWQNALLAADSTVFAGKADWRLPNIKELQSIVENRCYSPAINLTAFPNADSSWFWSSSPYAINSNYAWIVNFYYGDGNYGYKNYDYGVRLVRGGQ